MTGRMMNERLGKWSFWVMFIGFNLGFLSHAHCWADGDAAAHLHLFLEFRSAADE